MKAATSNQPITLTNFSLNRATDFWPIDSSREYVLIAVARYV